MQKILFLICLIPWLWCSSAWSTTTYTYDTLNRLTKVEYSPQSSISYQYDSNGNILAIASQNSLQVGDINGDGTISLKDSVIGLKILTNSQTAEAVNSNAAVGGDQKIGLKDAIYTLQQSQPHRYFSGDGGGGTLCVSIVGDTASFYFFLYPPGHYITGTGSASAASISGNQSEDGSTFATTFTVSGIGSLGTGGGTVTLRGKNQDVDASFQINMSPQSGSCI